MSIDSIQMPSHSRVWIYTSDRILTIEEQALLHKFMQEFTDRWTAHGSRLEATHALLHNSVLILIANEQKAMASGCSIDDSVKEIKQLGSNLGVDFFNRHRVVFQEKEDSWTNKGVAEFWAMRKAGLVTSETLVVNPLCSTLGEFVNSGEIPFAQSWHQEMWER
jgi:hypothetical protein